MILELNNVSYRYADGDRSVIQNLSLTLPEASRTAIMGGSGLGKTTLLHLMAGLLPPNEGTITGIPAGGVSLAFQEPRLLPWLTVLQNLAAAAPQAPPAHLSALLAELGLSGWGDRRPGALSGGMAQRVSLARALAFASPLLLLDEPFSGLDAESKATAARVILARHSGTIVAVVHDPLDAELLQAEVLRPFGGA